MFPKILQLTPQYRDYVWGGERLRPGHAPTAEAWVVYEENRVSSGSLEGRTLRELAAEYPQEFLGEATDRRSIGRFPLLIKLLDCAAWLSVQVHPNDEQAGHLAGTGERGKTEAWHILEAEAGARLAAGVQEGVTQEQVEEAIRSGRIGELLRYLTVRAGDTIFMPAGTVHALGPGLLLYEIQQSSDLTYRIYDWGRPETSKRPLHIAPAVAVADAASRPQAIPCPRLRGGERTLLCKSPYFQLERLAVGGGEVKMDTGGVSFEALTVIEGKLTVKAGEERVALERFESALMPAGTGRYEVNGEGETLVGRGV
jgi:mannose-6-phosphate isomerase